MILKYFPLHTQRLLLRPLNENDAGDYYRMMSNADTVRYLYQDVMDFTSSKSQLMKRVNITSQSLSSASPIMESWKCWLAVEIADTHTFIGEIGLGLLTPPEEHHFEIGYVFLPDFRGFGYATEAAKALLKFGFDALHARKIVGRLDPRNTPSSKLLVSIGLNLEEIKQESEFLKGEWTDEATYSIVQHEFSAFQNVD